MNAGSVTVVDFVTDETTTPILADETPTSRAYRGARFVLRYPAVFISPLIVIALVALWQWAVTTFDVSTYVLPAPSEIWTSLHGIISTATFWQNVSVTVQEAVLGFALGAGLAFLISLVISEIALLERAAMPYMVAFQAVPTVALAPIIVISVGYGLTSKVVIAAIIVFFPMLVNCVVGLRATGMDRIELVRSLGGTRWQVLLRIKLVGALPYIFAGLDIAIVLSVVGAVVGEFVGAKAGLGYAQLQANYNFDIPGSFAILVVMAVIGIGMHEIVLVVRRRVVFWEQH
ncbi:ABC transporter permease [Streptomyces canus]|uniref:ABC transporter permease n=1 Tax=Streptomyces canus TaxID=58343 RepID=UPI0003722006|nr:ABC transporter permease [Streptomyces canus]